MDETRRFRIPLIPALLLFAVAGFAANVPVSWFASTSAEERRAEVFSAFVNLTAEPGEDPLGLLDTVTRLSGQDARVRETRRAHILPGLLEAYAERIDMPIDWLRGAVLDPAYAHPFDITQFEVSEPEFARYGAGDAWRWGFAASGGKDLSPEDAALDWCARWLVVWDDNAWFYAPVGTDVLNEMLQAAAPNLADEPLTSLKGCDVNE